MYSGYFFISRYVFHTVAMPGGKCMKKIMKEKSLAKLAPYGQTNKSPFLNDPPPLKEAARQE